VAGVAGVGASETFLEGVAMGPVPYIASRSDALTKVWKSESGVVARLADGDPDGEVNGVAMGEGAAETVSGVPAGVIVLSATCR